MELRQVGNYLQDQHVDKLPPIEGAVVVTGPACSGTRLLARVVDASPDLHAFHDQSHGARVFEGNRGVVVITRNPVATDKSREARFGKMVRKREVSEKEIHGKYGDALWVTYERMTDDVNLVIEDLAKHFGVLPWQWEGEEITNENAKWLNE